MSTRGSLSTTSLIGRARPPPCQTSRRDRRLCGRASISDHHRRPHVKRRLAGKQATAIIGVVASGNLEVFLERVLPGANCEIEIATPVTGYDETWKAVIDEFVERFSPGGLRISINDGGARPDTVFLRLMQGCALMENA